MERIPESDSSFARSTSRCGLVVRALRPLELALRLDPLGRRRVGDDVEERIARLTRSPTSAWQRFTIPEIFDLTWNLRRGSIFPTATALSVIDPVTTSIFLRPSSAPSRLCSQAYAPTTAPAKG